jgi:hypothetical protein
MLPLGTCPQFHKPLLSLVALVALVEFVAFDWEPRAFRLVSTFLPKSPPKLWKLLVLCAQQSITKRQAIVITITAKAVFILNPPF